MFDGYTLSAPPDDDDDGAKMFFYVLCAAASASVCAESTIAHTDRRRRAHVRVNDDGAGRRRSRKGSKKTGETNIHGAGAALSIESAACKKREEAKQKWRRWY